MTPLDALPPSCCPGVVTFPCFLPPEGFAAAAAASCACGHPSRGQWHVVKGGTLLVQPMPVRASRGPPISGLAHGPCPLGQRRSENRNTAVMQASRSGLDLWSTGSRAMRTTHLGLLRDHLC